MKVGGSVVLTPNNRLFIKRVNTHAQEVLRRALWNDEMERELGQAHAEFEAGDAKGEQAAA